MLLGYEDVTFTFVDKPRTTRCIMKGLLTEHLEEKIGGDLSLVHTPQLTDTHSHIYIIYIRSVIRSPQLKRNTLACLLSSTSTGSLPPSPADSGVSDVDSSSSGGQPCSEELKARLGLPLHCPPQSVTGVGGGTAAGGGGHVPAGTFLNPNFYHNSPPLRNIWTNRNVPTRKFRAYL